MPKAEKTGKTENVFEKAIKTIKISKTMEKQSMVSKKSEKQVTASKKQEKPVLVTKKSEMRFFQDNPFILWDGAKSYSCGCPRGPDSPKFWPRSTAINHSKTHGYSIYGQLLEQKVPIDSKETQVENDSSKEKMLQDKIKAEIEALEQPNPDAILFSKVDEGLRVSTISSFIEGLKEVAKDPEVMYVFNRLKQEQRVPKGCTLGQFIKMTIGYYCRKFGHNFAFYQDTTVLGPEERQIQREIFYEYLQS